MSEFAIILYRVDKLLSKNGNCNWPLSELLKNTSSRPSRHTCRNNPELQLMIRWLPAVEVLQNTARSQSSEYALNGDHNKAVLTGSTII